MRASIGKVINAFGEFAPPSRITQKPFDYDSSHYWRLCQVARNKSHIPDNVDLINYALDMQYMQLQPELLRFLLPVCLKAWRKYLFTGEFGGFVEHLGPALLEGKVFSVLNKKECETVAEYMRNTFLDRMDAESELHFIGADASLYVWLQALSTHCILFSELESLWKAWWEMGTKGLAICCFQFTSILMYEDYDNPLFDDWSEKEGGGPPMIFWENDAHLYEEKSVWKSINIDFICSELSLEYVRHHLDIALTILNEEHHLSIGKQIICDFDDQVDTLKRRLDLLPKIMRQINPDEYKTGWCHYPDE